jgi:hypothetical protein
MARPTAKAALERLVYEGILRRATNKTARVPLMDADDIRDLYYSRAFPTTRLNRACGRLISHVSGRSVTEERPSGPDKPRAGHWTARRANQPS